MRQEEAYLFVRLAQRSMLERFANVFSPLGQEPALPVVIIYYNDLGGFGLDDNNPGAKDEVGGVPETVRDRGGGIR